MSKCDRTWRVSPTTAARVRALADRLSCWDSDLVEVLLRHALDDLEAGRWAGPKLRPAWYVIDDDETQDNGG